MNNREQRIVIMAFAFLLITMGVFVLRVSLLGQPMKILATQHDVVVRFGEVKE